MKTSLRSRLDKHFVSASALAAAAAIGGAIDTAEATVVYSGVVNMPVATNVNGIYLNVVTGVRNDVAGTTGAAAVPGWDINIYSTTPEMYGFGNPAYAFVGTSNTTVTPLAAGATIGPATCTATGSASGATFPTTGGAYYGFAFQNEAMGNATQYGWILYISGGAGSATPGTVVSYAYENSGAPIVAGDTGSATGACCFANGTCTPNLTPAACTSAGGTYNGAATCAAANCPQPGACCNADGSCTAGLQPGPCTASGGTFAGAGVACGAANCPQPGACCLPNSTCTPGLQPAACVAQGGTFEGAGSSCGSVTCPFYYLVDDGSSENEVGGGNGGSFAYANQFTADPVNNTITTISIAFGYPSTVNGSPITAYLWDDPNQDGSPTDAVVLASVSGVISGASDNIVNTNPFVDFAIPPTTLAPGHKFFVGFVYQTSIAGQFAGDLDQSSTNQGVSWWGDNTVQNAFDPNNWTGNGTIVETTSTAGFPGNWLIRAKAVASTTPGACCHSDGTCAGGVTAATCFSGGGTSFVSGATCAAANCPAPGACCKADGSCQFELPVACTGQGGTFHGAGVTCAAGCPQPGACCTSTGTCSVVQASACTAAGSTYGGNGTTCAGVCPTGACCKADGSCSTLTSAGCSSQGGTWTAGADCSTYVCTGGFGMSCGTIPGTFTDISTTGAAVAITTGSVDDGTGQITTVAGNSLVPAGTTLYPCTNGFISNLQTFEAFTNGVLPDTADGFTLGLFPDWDDLYLVQTAPIASIMYQNLTESGVSVDVIEWVNVRRFANQAGPFGNFEVKIFNPGGPALVQYLYQDMSWDLNGNSSTVGVQWNATAAYAVPGLNGNATESGTGPLANNSVCSIFGPTAASTCYANCDHSTAVPFLNVSDFTCFLQHFANGNPANPADPANCDHSTVPPVLNVSDFTCFLQKFAAGCSAP